MLLARRQLILPVERVRSRVSAYIYGNILVLAAILATSPESIAHGTAVIFVVATAATTFLAHVVAHRIGQSIGRSDDDALRLHLAQEARDAVPIMSSGAGPAVLLTLGAGGWLPPELSQLLAEAVVVLRLAGMAREAGMASSSLIRLAGLMAMIGGFVYAVVGLTESRLVEYLS